MDSVKLMAIYCINIVKKKSLVSDKEKTKRDFHS
jgi:hypothetical protein